MLHYGALPTLYYYFQTRFPAAQYLDTRSNRPSLAALQEGRRIVIVRHAAKDWLRFLVQHAAAGSVVFFVDDDLPGFLEDRHLPVKYALRSWFRFRSIRPSLLRLGCSTFVSTAALASRYCLPEAAILPPLPPLSDIPAFPAMGRKTDNCIVFYHGTTSHLREILWLRGILAQAVEANKELVCEVFGDASINRGYRGMTRVRVLHPMPWPAFLEYTRAQRLHIGLAPLLADSPFNATRSWVKFFDITRAGGVGVYSDSPVFREVVRHGENGLLVDETPAAWTEAVCDLAGDPDLRARLYAGAVETMKTLCG